MPTKPAKPVKADALTPMQTRIIHHVRRVTAAGHAGASAVSIAELYDNALNGVASGTSIQQAGGDIDYLRGLGILINIAHGYWALTQEGHALWETLQNNARVGIRTRAPSSKST